MHTKIFKNGHFQAVYIAILRQMQPLPDFMAPGQEPEEQKERSFPR